MVKFVMNCVPSINSDQHALPAMQCVNIALTRELANALNAKVLMFLMLLGSASHVMKLA